MFPRITDKPEEQIVAIAEIANELEWIDQPAIKQWDVFNTNPLWALKHKVLKEHRSEQSDAYS